MEEIQGSVSSEEKERVIELGCDMKKLGISERYFWKRIL